MLYKRWWRRFSAASAAGSRFSAFSVLLKTRGGTIRYVTLCVGRILTEQTALWQLCLILRFRLSRCRADHRCCVVVGTPWWGIRQDRIEEEGQDKRWGEKNEQPTAAGCMKKTNNPESGGFWSACECVCFSNVPITHTVKPHTWIYINTFIICVFYIQGSDVTVTCVKTSCLKNLPLLRSRELHLLFPVGIISPFSIWSPLVVMVAAALRRKP